MEPVLNPDGTQAISAAECERYVSYLRTLTDHELSREMEKWEGFRRNRSVPWAEDEWCLAVVYEEMERRAIQSA